MILPDIGSGYPVTVFVKQFTGTVRGDPNFSYTNFPTYPVCLSVGSRGVALLEAVAKKISQPQDVAEAKK